MRENIASIIANSLAYAYEQCMSSDIEIAKDLDKLQELKDIVEAYEAVSEIALLEHANRIIVARDIDRVKKATKLEDL